MLPLEVMGPGGGLSMLLLPRLTGEMPAESSLAGGNSDGSTQMRLDDGGAPSSAGGWGRQRGSGGFCTALDSKFCDSFPFFGLVRVLYLLFSYYSALFVCFV